MTKSHLTFALYLLIVTTFTQANETNTTEKISQESISISGLKKQHSEPLAQLADKKNTQIAVDKNALKLSGKTRKQVLNERIKAFKLANKTQALDGITQTSSKAQTNAIKNYSFSIYQGYAQLIEDYDEDGFFQTFSVTFDADIYDPHYIIQTDVYADLYLSKNGGDWIHYYTTDIFTIEGESEDDIFEVYTTLNQGYKPEHYDVLIDLYEVGYQGVVATYSSNDTNDLYALPLESSDYDPDYVEYHTESHSHGGSMAYLVLYLVAVTGLRKTFLSFKG